MILSNFRFQPNPGKKEELILILKKQLDRFNRIVRIVRPSTEGPLAAGEKKSLPR